MEISDHIEILNVEEDEEESFEEKRLTTKEIESFEQKIKFKPTGTCNYFCTKYDVTTKVRTVFGNGALSLDQFMSRNMFAEFCNYYMLDRPQVNYHLSVVLPSTESVNLIKMVGYTSKSERAKTVQNAYQLYFEIFDEVFKMFIKDGKRIRHYRSDTHFKTLVASYRIYRQQRKEFLEEGKWPLAN